MNKNPNLIAQYEQNITEFAHKNILDVIIPNSLEELVQVVNDAREQNINLYTVSAGQNWGLGSKQPVVKNSIVVNLKNLNKIIEVNEQYRYAIIEPGVTQAQFSEYLEKNHPKFKFPVTGSAKSTSVVGNMQERGAAAFGHRNKMVVAMEVLLSSGEFLKTGFWHFTKSNDPMTFHYPNGVGADLRGLFIQSNMAITTKMVVRLQPQVEGVIFLVQFNEKSLKEITNLLRKLYEEKIIDDGTVITNQNDPRTTKNKEYEYSGEWLAVASFSGNNAIIKNKKRVLKKYFGNLEAKYFFLSTHKSPFGLHPRTLVPFIINFVQNNEWFRKKLSLKVMKSGDTMGDIIDRFAILKDFYKGKPTNYSIQTMAKMNDTILENEDLDNSNILGISCVLPAVPFDGDAAIEVSNIVNEVSQKWGVKPFHNLASIDDMTFEGFYRIYFDRKSDKEIAQSLGWNKELHARLREKNFLPYRLDNERMKDFVNDGDTFWKTLNKLKLSIDENNILARGKYNYE